jgi:hypothetical protein
MRMRSLWDELVHSRAFWISYVSAGVDFIGCPTLLSDQRLLWGYPSCGVTLDLALPSAYWFRLNIDAGQHRLQLSHEDFDSPVLLGTMDAHQMSDVFRWGEFQAVTRHLTENAGPAWAHELLLSSYVAVTEDCGGEHLTLLRRCLWESKVFRDAEVEHVVAYSRRVAVRRDFRWIDTPDLGWVAEGRDAYSMRHTQGDFNFAAFREFLTTVGGSA